jgi:hypothetical protein
MKWLIVVVLLLTGCAQRQLAINFDSKPQGAVLYEGSKRIGFTPIQLRYNLTPDELATGRTDLAAIRAEWPSGAQSGFHMMAIQLRDGYEQSLTFIRPAAIPGHDKDAQFAAEVLRLAKTDQTDAQKAAEFWRMYNAIGKQYPADAAWNCTTFVVQKMIIGNCAPLEK